MTSSTEARSDAAPERAISGGSRREWLAEAAGIAGSLLGLLVSGCALDPDAAAQETESRLSGIPQQGISLGHPRAPVTLTEFLDLQCGHCRDVAVDVLPGIVDRYVRTGRVRIVSRTLTFLGPGSVKAARVAAAIGLQNHFFQFTELFLQGQGHDGSGHVTDASLRGLAASIPGVDVTRAMADRNSAAVIAQLEEASLEADRLGLHGVPAFLLGRTGEEPRLLHLRSLTVDELAGPIDRLLLQRRAGSP